MKRDLPDNPVLLRPWEIVNPHTGEAGAWKRLTGSGRHAGMASAADLRPPVPRPGSEAFLQCPSRSGNQLRYRDGRVEFLPD